MLGHDICKDWLFEQAAAVLILGEEQFDVTPQIGIFSAGFFEKCCAGVRRKVQCGVEQLFNPSPKFRIHTNFRSDSRDSITRITTLGTLICWKAR
jgi:hypothetical protein